ncbi:hypothetical protein [Actinomyces lilanjuaniae]|uniref:hypothetical protein n=1 Tax=Actinomyces lilanjuaniae TaxID=2321394 RepID=UPI001FA954D7|nr:hypothetical protein [Actinomyces lilanjuaniae]
MLLHGIMSSIAEYYSRSLANEIIRGMGEKARNDGTLGKAPLGYINVRARDEHGREIRIVDLNEERAQLHRMLRLPYYKGIVTLQGVEYPGQHEPWSTSRPGRTSRPSWPRVAMVSASASTPTTSKQRCTAVSVAPACWCRTRAAAALHQALDLLEDCHRLYSDAPGHLRKLLNQVFFDTVLVNPLVDEEGRVVLPDDRPSDEGDGGVDNANINPDPADGAAGDQLADQADGAESADSLSRLLAYVSSNASLQPPFD